jgi:hypothetical protein
MAQQYPPYDLVNQALQSLSLGSKLPKFEENEFDDACIIKAPLETLPAILGVCIPAGRVPVFIEAFKAAQERRKQVRGAKAAAALSAAPVEPVFEKKSFCSLGLTSADVKPVFEKTATCRVGSSCVDLNEMIAFGLRSASKSPSAVPVEPVFEKKNFCSLGLTSADVKPVFEKLKPVFEKLLSKNFLKFLEAHSGAASSTSADVEPVSDVEPVFEKLFSQILSTRILKFFEAPSGAVGSTSADVKPVFEKLLSKNFLKFLEAHSGAAGSTSADVESVFNGVFEEARSASSDAAGSTSHVSKRDLKESLKFLEAHSDAAGLTYADISAANFLIKVLDDFERAQVHECSLLLDKICRPLLHYRREASDKAAWSSHSHPPPRAHTTKAASVAGTRQGSERSASHETDWKELYPDCVLEPEIPDEPEGFAHFYLPKSVRLFLTWSSHSHPPPCAHTTLAARVSGTGLDQALTAAQQFQDHWKKALLQPPVRVYHILTPDFMVTCTIYSAELGSLRYRSPPIKRELSRDGPFYCQMLKEWSKYPPVMSARQVLENWVKPPPIIPSVHKRSISDECENLNDINRKIFIIDGTLAYAADIDDGLRLFMKEDDIDDNILLVMNQVNVSRIHAVEAILEHG